MPLIDYLLLTPLDEEWNSIRQALAPDLTSRPIDEITYYRWKQAVNQPDYAVGDYLIVAASMAEKTPGQALAGVFSKRAIDRWKPARVVLMGIAGSLEPTRLQLGDVVVPNEIFGYEVGDVKGNNTTFRKTVNQLDALGLDRVRSFRNDPTAYAAWQSECLSAGNELLGSIGRPPQLHIAPVASGNNVVKAVWFGRKLQKDINAKIAAVEMEAVGLWRALYQDVKHTDALMIRGVSDYADSKKGKLEKTTKGAWRSFAAANAARLLRAIWRRGPVPPLSSNYKLNLSLGPYDRFRQADLPNIDIKKIGTQAVAFPHLLRRTDSTPPLRLRITATKESGIATMGFRGLCIVESPERHILDANSNGTDGISFAVPGSERGLHVELLLSFSHRVEQIMIVCEDDFGRVEQAIAREPDTKG